MCFVVERSDTVPADLKLVSAVVGVGDSVQHTDIGAHAADNQRSYSDPLQAAV